MRGQKNCILLSRLTGEIFCHYNNTVNVKPLNIKFKFIVLFTVLMQWYILYPLKSVIGKLALTVDALDTAVTWAALLHCTVAVIQICIMPALLFQAHLFHNAVVTAALQNLNISTGTGTAPKNKMVVTILVVISESEEVKYCTLKSCMIFIHSSLQDTESEWLWFKDAPSQTVKGRSSVYWNCLKEKCYSQ